MAQDIKVHSMRDLVGDQIDGQYSVDDILGEGGMGLVFRGTQLSLKRPVAIKVLKIPDTEDNAENISRFVREVELISKLSHPNIVSVFDARKEARGFYYVVMELVDGAPLSDFLGGKRFRPELALSIAHQLAGALIPAHNEGVIHRDIKPENLLLTMVDGREFQTKLVDFGIARAMHVDDSLTATGMVVGTPHYMAPEQLRGQWRDYGPWTDVYALGVTLYELLTGQLPFDANTFVKLALMKLKDQAPPISTQIEGLNLPELDELLRWMMANELEDRLADVQRLRKEIEHIQEKYGLHPPQATMPSSLEEAIFDMLETAGSPSKVGIHSATQRRELIENLGGVDPVETTDMVEPLSMRDIVMPRMSEWGDSTDENPSVSGDNLRIVERDAAATDRGPVLQLGPASEGPTTEERPYDPTEDEEPYPTLDAGDPIRMLGRQSHDSGPNARLGTQPLSTNARRGSTHDTAPQPIAGSDPQPSVGDQDANQRTALDAGPTGKGRERPEWVEREHNSGSNPSAPSTAQADGSARSQVSYDATGERPPLEAEPSPHAQDNRKLLIAAAALVITALLLGAVTIGLLANRDSARDTADQDKSAGARDNARAVGALTTQGTASELKDNASANNLSKDSKKKIQEPTRTATARPDTSTSEEAPGEEDTRRGANEEGSGKEDGQPRAEDKKPRDEQVEGNPSEGRATQKQRSKRRRSRRSAGNNKGEDKKGESSKSFEEGLEWLEED